MQPTLWRAHPAAFATSSVWHEVGFFLLQLPPTPLNLFASWRGDCCLTEVAATGGGGGGVGKFFHPDGRGSFREPLSTRAEERADQPAVLCRFLVPHGTFARLRLDPIGGGAITRIAHASDIAADASLIRAFPPSSYLSSQQIESARIVGATLDAAASPGSDDPQLLIPQPYLALDTPPAVGDSANPRR